MDLVPLAVGFLNHWEGYAFLTELQGFRKIVLRPVIIPQIGAFEAKYKTQTGIMRVAWIVQGDFVDIKIEIPEGAALL